MFITNYVINNRYFDSVMLMSLSNLIKEKVSDLEEASAIMGSDENKKLLRDAGLLTNEGEDALPGDLIIALKGSSEEAVNRARKVVDEFLSGRASLFRVRMAEETQTIQKPAPGTIKEALKILPDANLVLISLPGEYAGSEAMEAISRGLNVMVFSDNVPVEQEITLKKSGEKKGLFVLGPDCGTSIINGVALGFANVVRRGVFGIVGAAGTGLQEITSLLHRKGYGITHAIGTGGRDLSEEVGGIAFINAIKALGDDPHTEVMILLSKPPSEKVAKKIIDIATSVSKPSVIVFLGSEEDLLSESRMNKICFARNLEEAVEMGIAILEKRDFKPFEFAIPETRVNEIIERESRKIGRGKFLRGLFSGGTLADEAIFILKKKLGGIHSNSVKDKNYYLEDPNRSVGHTVIDMGDDYFTKARPHPMIDFTLRKERILREAQSKDCGIILFDVVLGYGAHEDPASELVPVITKACELAQQEGRYISFVCSVTGTDEDPQNYTEQRKRLEEVGVIVMDSNAQASFLCGHLLG